ncbi:MAG: alkaline phosphatase family protein [Candidatus Micrarchaeota archaeon]|nr:alkaline phosphatase family protein [Candidatus Micrarchaeota archaeon]MDE1824401.1 alkaline phosphatase family protein [Candidatus Micrarchaeota archaeon]MDE1849876.1 alkaline phosphatase family protein [Candidatus Micrarchaeota archaeon]
MASIISELLDKGFVLPDHGNSTLSAVRSLAERKSDEKKLFMFIDGFGYNVIERYQSICDSSQLFKKSDVQRITTQFPSTTPNILANFNSGLETSNHGIVGGNIPVSEDGTIAGSLALATPKALGVSGDPRIMGLEASEVYPKPLLINSIKERYSFAVVTHEYISNTDLNLFFFGKGYAIPYKSWEDGLARTAEAMRKEEKDFIYFYYDGLDHEEHFFRLESKECEKELARIIGGIDTLLAAATECGYQIVITTDHGHMPKDTGVDLNRLGIMEYLDTHPWGEPRSAFLKVNDGKESEFEDFFEKNISDKAMLVESEELISAGLFGGRSVGKELRYRFGTHVMLPFDGVLFDYVYPNVKPETLPKLKSHHGGLDQKEMYVPVIRYNLE